MRETAVARLPPTRLKRCSRFIRPATFFIRMVSIEPVDLNLRGRSEALSHPKYRPVNICFGRVSAPSARATLIAMPLFSQITAVLDRLTVKPFLCSS